MPTRITLEKAKKILQTDKVYENGNNMFNIAVFGRGKVNMTFVVSRDFLYNKQGVVKNPIEPNYYCPELLKGRNCFKGCEGYPILFGDFSFSKNGKPVFAIKPPDKAQDIFIDTISLEQGDKDDREKTLYHRNGFYSNYWVFPIADLKYGGEMPISDYLEEYAKEDIETDLCGEKEYERKVREEENGKKLLAERMSPLLKKIKQLNPDYNHYELRDNGVFISDKGPYVFRDAENYLQNMQEDLKKLEAQKTKKDLIKDFGIDPSPFDDFQINEIVEGIRQGLSPEQVSSFAKPFLKAYDTYQRDFDDESTWLPDENNITHTNQMKYFRERLCDGETVSNIKLCINHNLSPQKADTLLNAIKEHNATTEVLSDCKWEDFNANNINQVVKAITENTPKWVLDICSDSGLIPDQVKEIIQGYKEGLTKEEILTYATFGQSYYMMDNDYYSKRKDGFVHKNPIKKPCYFSANEMAAKRTELIASRNGTGERGGNGDIFNQLKEAASNAAPEFDKNDECDINKESENEQNKEESEKYVPKDDPYIFYDL